MPTPSKAVFDQASQAGSFDLAKYNGQNQSLHQGDWETLRPRAQGTPDLTLDVQAATVQSFYRQIYNNDVQITFAGGNSPTFTAPTTNPRIDLLYLNSAGALAISQGTEAASPVPPTYPDLAQNIPICEVFNRTTEVKIVNHEDNGANPNEGYIYRDVRPFAALLGTKDASTTVLGKVKTSITPGGDPTCVETGDGRVPTQDENDAMVGTSGAPSSTNKYVTANDALLKPYRIGHTYTISGEIKVPVGDTDFINPFFVSVATGQTAKVVKVRYVINAGTSVTCKIQKNGADLTGFTSIAVTTTIGETDPSDQTLADNDKLALVVTAVSGTPKNLAFTIFIEYEQ